MTETDRCDFDVAMIGAGLVGACIALGISRLGPHLVAQADRITALLG